MTVVVPVRNRAKMVQPTLDSIAASSCQQFRLVIVDNASTDGTLDLCRRWAAAHADSCVDIIVAEETAPGAAAARNKGLSLCSTPYVYFFDSDDLFSASFVADIVPRLQRYATDATASAPDMLFIPVQQQRAEAFATRAYIHSAAPAAHILCSMLCTPSMLFRTAWLRSIGGWDARLRVWDDWELGLRVLLHQPRIEWLLQPYHRIYIHPDSITGPALSARTAAICQALAQAHIDISSASVLSAAAASPSAVFASSLKALFLHTYITAAKMHREGSLQSARTLLRWAQRAQPTPSRWSRLQARLLYTYVHRGGRGAWRVAWWMV